MTPFVAQLVWLAGVIGWFIIRYPAARRSRRTPKVPRQRVAQEPILMAISATGLGVGPAIYVATGGPRFAAYQFAAWQGWAGAIVFAAALVLFRLTHKRLGRNWS